MIKDIKKLTVKYNDKIVGYLAEIDKYNIGFQYDDEWIKTGFSISPISLPLDNKIFISEDRTFDGLFGVFADSLPDGWGELLVTRKLASIGINFQKLSPLTKLSIINENGLGGLSYEPTQLSEEKSFNFDLDKIALEAKKVLEDDFSKQDLDSIYELGGSSGGARPKAHIKINDEYWIVKFPLKIDSNDVGKMEYDANSLAKECGINVNEFKLFESKICPGYFGAKRFDRQNGKRVHMISLSSILETTHRIPNLDYKHLFQVINLICVDKNDLYEAFRRMCFNVLYENKDDHGKNFAFLYDEEAGGYKLSPAYDLTKTINKPEHEMTVLGIGKPNTNTILNLAKELKLNINKCKNILNNIQKILNKN